MGAGGLRGGRFEAVHIMSVCLRHSGLGRVDSLSLELKKKEKSNDGGVDRRVVECEVTRMVE